jgi:predicted acylesterase/phospholipase RssA
MVTFLQGVLAGVPGSDGTTKRNWTITAADLADGAYTEFNQTNTNFTELPDAAVSSSSIPGVFPPHYFKNKWFMDGGTIWNINTNSAI